MTDVHVTERPFNFRTARAMKPAELAEAAGLNNGTRGKNPRERTFRGFAAGAKTEKLQTKAEGWYPAIGEVKSEVDTKHGPRVKIVYTIAPDPDSGDKPYEVNELATPNLVNVSKLMCRTAAINGLEEMPEDADLSTMTTKGEVLVYLGIDQNGYNVVADVMPAKLG